MTETTLSILDNFISSKLFLLNISLADEFDGDENREDFHYHPREKEPIELGFVNEHVTFTDEESEHDEDREVIATLMAIFVAIKSQESS
jgi:hypothetical protein